MEYGRSIGIEAGARWQGILERLPRPSGGTVYAVGGWSRDRLLSMMEGSGLPSDDKELDLVVDRDFFPWVDSVCRSLAPWTVGSPHVERNFLTAKIELQGEGELLRLDLAGFRRESYPHPGALPRVLPGSFDEDARRRDFPMNALYLEWSPEKRRFVRLLDPFGGEHDLSLRRISLIRPEAFREDPTRIFRWARLAGRLRLASSPSLRHCLRDALKWPDLWREVGPARVFAEMERLIREADPLACVRLLFSSGLLASLTEKALVRLSPGRTGRLRRWESVRELLGSLAKEEKVWEGASREMFYLALLSGLERAPFHRAVASLGVGAKLERAISETLFRPARWPGGRGYEGWRRSAGADRGQRLGWADRMVSGQVVEALLNCGEGEVDFWREYLLQERARPPLIGGEVLLRYPSIRPEERKILLADIRFRQRTGEFQSREDVLGWLKECRSLASPPKDSERRRKG